MQEKSCSSGIPEGRVVFASVRPDLWCLWEKRTWESAQDVTRGPGRCHSLTDTLGALTSLWALGRLHGGGELEGCMGLYRWG